MPKPLFNAFKIAVYCALVALSAYWFFSEDTLSAFVDSFGWLILLGMMEYSSTNMAERHKTRGGKAAVLVVNGLAYSMILWGFFGYISDESWLDVVNAGSWLCVSAVLAWQVYLPGKYGDGEHRLVTMLKLGFYIVLIGCAVVWTLDADTVFDALDAWLWLVCFWVIELNVFKFEHDAGFHPEAHNA